MGLPRVILSCRSTAKGTIRVIPGLTPASGTAQERIPATISTTYGGYEWMFPQEYARTSTHRRHFCRPLQVRFSIMSFILTCVCLHSIDGRGYLTSPLRLSN